MLAGTCHRVHRLREPLPCAFQVCGDGVRWLCIGLSVVAVSCSQGSNRARQARVQAAGRPVGEVAATAHGAVERWHLSRKPRVSIGMLDGPEEYTFGYVVGAARLSSGDIVVGDGYRRRISYFDSAGRYIAGVGGTGAGPGEFRGLMWMHAWNAHEVAAVDGELGRVSIFSDSARFEDSWRIRWAWLGRARPLSLGSDSVLLMTVENEPWPPPKPGYGRDTVTLVSIPPNAVLADTLAVLANSDVYTARWRTTGPGGASGWEVYPVLRPFGRRVVAAAYGSVYVFESTGSPQITLWSKRRLIRTIRWDGTPRRVSGRDVSAYVRKAVEAADRSDRKPLRSTYEGLTPRRTVPAFTSVRVSDQGELWVERFCAPAADTCGWDVYTTSGRRRADVMVPRTLAIQEIGNGWLLALQRDTLGVKRVTLYGILRSGF